MIDHVTEAQCKSYLDILARKTGGKLVKKQSAFEMEMIAKVFDLIRKAGVSVPSEEDFLNRYATTLGPLVYLPDGWDPMTRLLVGTHEFEHVAQWNHGEFESDLGIPGRLDFAWLYLTNGEARVRLEQRANRAYWEVAHIGLGLPLPEVSEACRFLEAGYALSGSDLELSKMLATTWLNEVRYQLVDTEAGAAGIDALRSVGIV